jgi:hypothetical protein
MSFIVNPMAGRIGPTGPRTDGLMDGVNRFTRESALVVQPLHSEYTEQTYRENVFLCSQDVTGLIFKIDEEAGGGIALWNPSSSRKVINVIKLELTWISGTLVPGGLGWYYYTGCGDALNAAKNVTFTHVDPVCLRIGSPRKSVVKWSPAVATFFAHGTFLMGAGVSVDTHAAASTIGYMPLEKYYNGTLQIEPGVTIKLCSLVAMATGVFSAALTIEEIDI